MNAASRHIILEHHIQLEFEREDDARRWQQEIGPIVRRRLMPLLDRIFSAHSTPDSLIRLDTLELDLGNLDPSQVERQLEERTKALLGPKLAEEIRKTNRSKEVQSDSALELLSTFFFTGALPWWADIHDAELLPKAVRTLASKTPGKLRRLVLAVVRQEQAFRRMLNALDEASLRAIASAWPLPVGQNWAIIEAVLTAQAQKHGVPERQAGREWWKGVLYGLSHEAAPSETRTALYGLWQAASTFHWDAGEIRKTMEVYFDRSPLNDQRSAGQHPADTPSRRKMMQEWETLLNPKSVALPITGPDQGETRKQRDRFEEAFFQKPEVFIDNAGLVLFWPFLQRFFEHAGLVADKAFLDAEAPFKAAMLLQYLAEGSTEALEYLLPLNKVLCGISVEEALPENLILTPEDTEVADALLDAVQEHARPALGNVSSEGLRQAFVQRTGLLSVEDGQWMLRVERETHDILLDRLPWGFRVVKLPWMPTPLLVDW